MFHVIECAVDAKIRRVQANVIAGSATHSSGENMAIRRSPLKRVRKPMPGVTPAYTFSEVYWCEGSVKCVPARRLKPTMKIIVSR